MASKPHSTLEELANAAKLYRIHDGPRSMAPEGCSGCEADAAVDALVEQFEALETRVHDELQQLERWAGEQNAGNAFAEQVRYWVLAHLDRLEKSNPASVSEPGAAIPVPGVRTDDVGCVPGSETPDPASSSGGVERGASGVAPTPVREESP